MWCSGSCCCSTASPSGLLLSSACCCCCSLLLLLLHCSCSPLQLLLRYRLPLARPLHPQLLRVNDGRDLSHALLQPPLIVHHNIVKVRDVLQLLARCLDPHCQLVQRLRLARHQPLHQLGLALSTHKDGEHIGHEPLESGGTLHVNAQHHVGACRQRLVNLLAGDALVVAVHQGVLQQLACGDPLLKLFAADKKVVAALNLRGTLGP
mmetsp:Transcript_36722/g.81701  ORF Transcript_36722/g.81701 Transcript_36722/m.81701 type:complete len:207 (-) Transcript_36722:682-1302(-)